MNLLDRFRLLQEQRIGSLAVLLDPDFYTTGKSVNPLLKSATEHPIDFFLVGGSHLSDGSILQTVRILKRKTGSPVILFPGDPSQVCAEADGLLLLSLISGRNADLLIGKHVHAAPRIRKAALEVLPTGYLLIDSGMPTSVSYISQTQPLPANKPALAASTAMAGEMLGMSLIYLEAGSGATQSVPSEIIAAVRQSVNIPILVGGGISTPDQVHRVLNAGADVVVVGNAVEKDPSSIARLAGAVFEWNDSKRKLQS